MRKADPAELGSNRAGVAPCLPLPSSEYQSPTLWLTSSSPCHGAKNRILLDEQQHPGNGGVMATALYAWSSIFTAVSYPPSTSTSPPLCPHCNQPNTCVATNHSACTHPATQPAPSGLAAHCMSRSGWGWHLPLSPSCKDGPGPLVLQRCPSQAALEIGRIKAFMFPS